MEKLPQAIKIRSFVLNVPKKTLGTSNFRIYLILSPCYFRNSMQHVGKQPATETDCREYVFHTTPTPFYMYLPTPTPFCIYLPTPTPFCMYLLTPTPFCIHLPTLAPFYIYPFMLFFQGHHVAYMTYPIITFRGCSMIAFRVYIDNLLKWDPSTPLA